MTLTYDGSSLTGTISNNAGTTFTHGPLAVNHGGLGVDADWCFVLGGRTGSYTNGHYIKNLLVQSTGVLTYDGSLYCGDATCGAALLAAGWKVLSEWGSVNRFNSGLLIDSHADFEAAGWSVPPADSTYTYVSATTFDHSYYETNPEMTQWYRSSGPSAAYEHSIPAGTTRVVVSFFGASHTCIATIFDYAGNTVWTSTRNGDDLSSPPDPDVVSVDTSLGAARIRFQETGLCWPACIDAATRTLVFSPALN